MNTHQKETMLLRINELVQRNEILVELLNKLPDSEKIIYADRVTKMIEETRAIIQKEMSNMDELTNYEYWQLEKYGNILDEPVVLPSGRVEGTNEEIDRSSEWVERQAEQQLFEHEK